MITLTKKSQNVLNRLVKKSDWSNGSARMPSVTQIIGVLEELNIKYWTFGTVNVVEYSSGQNVYANSRHNGKEGQELKIEASNNKAGLNFSLDTSDSYYSLNTQTYAEELVKIIEAQIK